MYELSLGKHDFPWMSLTIVELTLCLLDDLFCFLSYTVCTWIAKYVLMMFQNKWLVMKEIVSRQTGSVSV